MFFSFKNKNKNKNLENISGYKDAIKMINFFMATYDWEKTKKSIEEIKEKELKGFNELIEKIDSEDSELLTGKEKHKQAKIYEKKVKELSDLENKLEKLKLKYDTKRETERFQLRFKKIRKQLDNFIRTHKSDQALDLLNNFLEENRDKDIVIKFYNKEKKIILRNIEKQKKYDSDKLKQNAKLEALKLIGENISTDNDVPEQKEKKISFIKILQDKLNFYKKIKEKIRRKKLLDEISLLIEEDTKVKNDIASQKLANIHKGLIKEMAQNNMMGYDFYGKILGVDKISGDAFGFNETKSKYNFFIGDATGHGIRAGFIITLLSRFFNDSVNKKLKEMIYYINNGLKQDLKSRNFITGIFFEIEKQNLNKIDYVGMGHEPMLIYREKQKKIEKLIPGGLAAGIRIISDVNHIKIKEIELEHGDIILTYSDGIAEAKSEEGEFYSINRLADSFQQIASNGSSLTDIYKYIIQDVKYFKGGTNFSDDVTLLLVKRNTDKDIIDENSKYLQDLKLEGKVTKNDIKKIKGKTKEEIKEEVEKIAKRKKTLHIIKSLETLYYTGETLKLKQEAIRFIKEGFIDKKINFYLKKAIANEDKYKIEQKEQRIRNKYSVLKELLKKEDYMTVIKESEDIIAKDGNI